METPPNPTPAPRPFPCLNLRNKEMFYQELGAEEDEYSSYSYWCAKTQEQFGPDGQPVGKGECSGGRGCYAG